MTKHSAKITLQKIWKARTAYLFLSPLLIGVICFCYYPPILAIVRSFTGWKIGASNAAYSFSLDNYIRLFRDEVFFDSIWNMFYINIPKLLIGIVVPLIMAEMLFWVKRKKLSALYRVLVLLPIITPGVISTYIWTYIYRTDGMLNGILNLFGFESEISWLNNAQTVIPAIIFMGFPWIGGTSVLINMSGLMNIPNEIGEAAQCVVCGCYVFDIYAIHIFEMMCTVMKSGAVRLMAVQNGRNRNIVVDYGKERYASFLQMHTDDPVGVPFLVSVEMPDGSARFYNIQEGYQERSMEHLVNFFATGIPEVDSGETIDLMGMLDAARKALKKPFTWFKI